MIKVIKFKADDATNSRKANVIRTKVFVEEQHVDPELEYDGKDQYARHYLVLYDKKAIGTARWRITGKGVKLERFAILPSFRNKGIGSELLGVIMKDVISLDKPVYLHSQLRAVPYYERYGFKKKGKKFTEAGIQHFLMIFEKNFLKDKNFFAKD